MGAFGFFGPSLHGQSLFLWHVCIQAWYLTNRSCSSPHGTSCCFSLSCNVDTWKYKRGTHFKISLKYYPLLIIDIINLLTFCLLFCNPMLLYLDSLWHPLGSNTLAVNIMLPSYLNSRQLASVMPWSARNWDHPPAKNISDWSILRSISQIFPRGPKTTAIWLFQCPLGM